MRRAAPGLAVSLLSAVCGAAFAQNNPSNLPLLIGQGAGVLALAIFGFFTAFDFQRLRNADMSMSVPIAASIGVLVRFALARYNPEGTLDVTFGGDGTVTTDFTGGFDSAGDVAIQDNGKIVAA